MGHLLITTAARYLARSLPKIDRPISAAASRFPQVGVHPEQSDFDLIRQSAARPVSLLWRFQNTLGRCLENPFETHLAGAKHLIFTSTPSSDGTHDTRSTTASSGALATPPPHPLVPPPEKPSKWDQLVKFIQKYNQGFSYLFVRVLDAAHGGAIMPLVQIIFHLRSRYHGFHELGLQIRSRSLTEAQNAVTALYASKNNLALRVLVDAREESIGYGLPFAAHRDIEQAIIRWVDERFDQRLLSALTRPQDDYEVRRKALETLARVGGPHILNIFKAALKKENVPRLRHIIQEALQAGEAQADSLLREQLQHVRPERLRALVGQVLRDTELNEIPEYVGMADPGRQAELRACFNQALLLAREKTVQALLDAYNPGGEFFRLGLVPRRQIELAAFVAEAFRRPPNQGMTLLQEALLGEPDTRFTAGLRLEILKLRLREWSLGADFHEQEPVVALSEKQRLELEFHAQQTQVRLATDPSRGELWVRYGEYYDRLGYTERAIACWELGLERLSELTPQGSGQHCARLHESIARKAINRQDYAEATRQLHRALEHQDDSLIAHLLLGFALRCEGHTLRGRRHYRIAEQLIANDPERASSELGKLAYDLRDFEFARILYEERIDAIHDLAAELTDYPNYADTMRRWGDLLIMDGRYDEASAFLGSVERVFLDNDDVGAFVEARLLRADINFYEERPDEGQRLLEDIRSYLVDSQNDEQQVNFALMLIRAFQMSGYIDEAMAELQKVAATCRRLGNEHLALWHLEMGKLRSHPGFDPEKHRVTEFRFDQGNVSPPDPHTQCIQSFNAALSLARKQRNQMRELEIFVELGKAHRNQGHYEAAVQALEEARALSYTLRSRRWLASITRELVKLYAMMDRWGAALILYERSHEPLRTFSSSLALACHYRDIGRIAHRYGGVRLARRLFEQSLERFEELSDTAQIAATCYDQAKVLKKIGRLEDAEQLFRRAENLFRGLGDGYHLALVREDFGLLYYRWSLMPERRTQQTANLRRAEELFVEARNFFQQDPLHRHRVARVLSHQIMLSSFRSDTQAVEGLIQQAMHIYDRLEQPLGLARLRLKTSLAFVRENRLTEASAQLDLVEDYLAGQEGTVNTTDRLFIFGEYHSLRGLVAQRQEQFQIEQDYRLQAGHYFERSGHIQDAIRAYRLAANLSIRLKDRAGQRQWLDKAQQLERQGYI